MILSKYSFGIGDRFGREGKAQLKALIEAKKQGLDITPVWNKSQREHSIIGTKPSDVRKEADDAVQIEDKMTQMVETFMKDFANLATAKQPLDGFDSKVDEIAVTMVKVAILGFAGVGKTTTLHLLRGETLPLVHDPTIGVSIKRLPEEVQNANIVLWDLAGQSRFSILWAKMIANAQVVVIVTDSTLENVLRSKKLVTLVKDEVPEAKVIGIANKQDLPTALTPERVGQILSIPTYELVAIDISYRDRLIQIIRKAILEGKADKAA